ncbi:MAG TPA: sugar-binding protein, partial [Kiritimatiellia bacterium]
GLQWDAEHLYLALDVTDDEIIAREPRKEIYRGDCTEFYIDFITAGRNFIWGDSNNFQIGFAPNSNEKHPASWSWFQDRDPGEHIVMAVQDKPGGYVIEASIDWAFLNQKPATGMVFGASVAIHDLDSKMRAMDKKLNWNFKKVAGKIGLGEITLRE